MKYGILLLSFLALLVFSGCVQQPESPTGAATAASQPVSNQQFAVSDSISIPLAGVSSQAKWFEYDAGGTTIRFFAVKGSDGSVKTAFDACDVCYYSKKGYRQQGGDMVCNNCGNKYPIDGLGVENRNPGGCWPSYLPSRVVGENVEILKSDIEAGKAMFA